MPNYSESDKDHFARALQDDIEILLEEFTEITGRKVTDIKFIRIKCEKSYTGLEYQITVETEK